MIDAILTGMTGRISTLHKVQPERPAYKQAEQEQKAPSSSDSLTLSKEALELYNTRTVNSSGQSENNAEDKNNPAELTDEQKEEVEKLKKRDQEVRNHEQAHMVAGAPYTYGIKYEYQKGPDKKDYAVGGSVQIDTRKEATPEKNLEKARIIKRSAQAPSEPSAQDKKVLAAALRMEQEARAELQQQGRTENTQRNQSAGIAQYMKNSMPSAGSTINISY